MQGGVVGHKGLRVLTLRRRSLVIFRKEPFTMSTQEHSSFRALCRATTMS